LKSTIITRSAALLVPGIIALLSPFPAWAEERALSLPQAIKYSRQNNSTLKAFREESGIYDASKIRAELLPNPTLDLEAATGALTGSGRENSLALGLSQEFLLAGKRGKRVAIAKQDRTVYRWRLADRERMVTDEVKSAFFDALLAKERLALTERTIDLKRQLLAVTKERLASGDIPELEMNLAKVEVARSEGARIDFAKTFQESVLRLSTLMGLPTHQQPIIDGKLEPARSLSKSLDDLKKQAQANRPDLKALEAENVRSDAEIALAEAERTPNITAGLVLRRDTTSMEIGGVEGKDTAYTVGVRLSLPLPVFDRNQAGVRESRARKNSSEARLAAAIMTVQREVEAAYASLQQASSILALYKTEILPQLEENLNLTQEAYRLGELGILAVIDEQKKFFEVNDGYLTALYNQQAAQAKLETAVDYDVFTLTSGGEK